MLKIIYSRRRTWSAYLSKPLATCAKYAKRSKKWQKISNIILDKAFKIHNSLGPGLFESVYEHIFLKNYKDEGLKVAQQLTLPVKYKNKKYKLGYRIDLMIEDKVIVKLKSVAAALDIHKK